MQTTKATQQKELDAKLNRHFLACSAFVGTAVLMTGQNADASIVYSGLQNLSVPTTNAFGGIYLDLTQPGSPFIPTGSGRGPAEGLNTLLPGWDINFYGSSSGTNLKWAYPTNGGPQTLAIYGSFSGLNRVAPLTAGTMIDGSSLLGTYQTLGTPWANKTAYMGVSFHDGANIRYGWVQITTSGASGLPASVVDWAYEDSGAGILAGDFTPVPEPSTVALGCLSAGALGLMAWRKKRKAN